MSLARVLTSMARHWVIVLVVLMATGPLARAVGEQVKPVYESRGSLLFLSPAQTNAPDGTIIRVNPFTRLGNAERVAASTVLIVSSTKVWSDRMKTAGAEGKYRYLLVSDGVVDITTLASTPAESAETLAVSITLLQAELARRQERAGAPPESWITSEILAITDQPAQLLGSKVRATAGVAVLGLAAAASAALIAEAFGIGERRRRRRAAARRPDEGVGDDGLVPKAAHPVERSLSPPADLPSLAASEPDSTATRRQRRRARRPPSPVPNGRTPSNGPVVVPQPSTENPGSMR